MGTHKQNGSSLVEVMIALFVLAIGLLGVLALQTKSMQYNQSAHTYTQAVFLANDIAERLRANPESAELYVGEFTTSTTDCSTTQCTSQQLAQWDKSSTFKHAADLLPGGEVEVTKVNSDSPVQLQVSVSFDDSRADGRVTDESYDGRKSYLMMVEI